MLIGCGMDLFACDRDADRFAGIDLRLELQPGIGGRADIDIQYLLYLAVFSSHSLEGVPLPSSLQTLTFGCWSTSSWRASRYRAVETELEGRRAAEQPAGFDHRRQVQLELGGRRAADQILQAVRQRQTFTLSMCSACGVSLGRADIDIEHLLHPETLLPSSWQTLNLSAFFTEPKDVMLTSSAYLMVAEAHREPRAESLRHDAAFCRCCRRAVG